jgi:glycosyltransferase involved in cell wall biosynthesis
VTLRVVQAHCVIDAAGRSPDELLSAWPTMPLVASAVARAGADVTVVCAARAAAHFVRDGVTYRFVSEPRIGQANGPGLAPWRLASAAQQARPQVIHFNGLDFPLHLRAMCRAGPAVLAQDHASSPAIGRPSLRRWGLARIAGAAFTSAQQGVAFKASGRLPAQMPVYEIPESSSTFTAGDQREARRKSGVYGDPALLWVGHLDPNKDPLTILRAVRQALRALPQLELWCAFGSAALLPAMQDLLREDEQLAAHVHLLGRVPHAEVETLCRASDIFVLGSHREGSGYALLEALACGLTPVVGDIPSFRSLTGNGAVGALVQVGDADGFASAIVAQARRPRRAARDAVLAHFAAALSPEALGHRLVNAYQALAAGAAR